MVCKTIGDYPTRPLSSILSGITSSLPSSINSSIELCIEEQFKESCTRQNGITSNPGLEVCAFDTLPTRPQTLQKRVYTTFYAVRSKCAKEREALRIANTQIVTRLTANCKGYLQIFCTGVSKNPSNDMLIMSRRRRHACENTREYYVQIFY